MCKDHDPIEFGPVPNLDICKRSLLIGPDQIFDVWREKSEKQQKWQIGNVVQIGQRMKPGLL